jgi:hypothetical protein
MGKALEKRRVRQGTCTDIPRDVPSSYSERNTVLLSSIEIYLQYAIPQEWEQWFLVWRKEVFLVYSIRFIGRGYCSISLKKREKMRWSECRVHDPVPACCSPIRSHASRTIKSDPVKTGGEEIGGERGDRRRGDRRRGDRRRGMRGGEEIGGEGWEEIGGEGWEERGREKEREKERGEIQGEREKERNCDEERDRRRDEEKRLIGRRVTLVSYTATHIQQITEQQITVLYRTYLHPYAADPRPYYSPPHASSFAPQDPSGRFPYGQNIR